MGFCLCLFNRPCIITGEEILIDRIFTNKERDIGLDHLKDNAEYNQSIKDYIDYN